MFGALDISTSGLVAQRIRLDTVAGNMLNAHTTLGPDQAYQRRVPVFSVGRSGDPADGPGVHVAEIVVDQRPGELVYDPDHIHAIKSGEHEGMVRQPNVNVLETMKKREDGRTRPPLLLAISPSPVEVGETRSLVAQARAPCSL